MKHASLRQLLVRVFVVMAVAVAASFGVLFAQVPQALAADNQLQTIRLGYYESRGFQNGSSHEQAKSGYGYEYLQRVASYSGWQYEYVYGDWEVLYGKLCKGEIDLLAGVSKPSVSSREVLFPTASMLNETYYVYKRGTDRSIVAGKADMLSGKRVGVISSTNSAHKYEKWVKESGSKARTVEFKTADKMHNALASGKIDAFVSSDRVAHGYGDVVAVEIVGKEPYYVAVNKTRPDILGQLNESQAILYTQDRIFLDGLASRYTADSSTGVYLTQDELDYMESHTVLRIGYLEDTLPFSATNPEGEVMGLFTNVLDAIVKTLPGNWSPHLEMKGFVSQADLYNALKNEEVDMVFPAGGDVWYAEQEGYLSSNAVVSTSMSLVFSSREGYSGSVSKIAVNKNNLLQRDYTLAYFPATQIVECDNIEDCLNAVKSGEATSTIVNGLRASALLRSQPTLSSVQLPDEELCCFGVGAGNSDLLRILNRGLVLIGPNYGTSASYLYTTELYKYTFSDFMHDYWAAVLVATILVIAAAAAYAVRRVDKIQAEREHEFEQNRKLEKALHTAEQASAAKDVLLANLSHDIRTPLNGILGVLDMNAKTADPAVIEENRGKAHAASEQLIHLMDDLLEMTRLKSGEIEAMQEEFSVEETLCAVVDSFQPRANDRDVALMLENRIELPAGVLARGSESFVRQVLENIIDNAIAYNRPGGQVRVCASLKQVRVGNAELEVLVEDTGIGMSEKFLEKVFEPFSQAKVTARSVYPGSGLGMPIAAELLKIMGGSIDVQSALDEGTKVTVVIPLELVEGGSNVADQADVAGIEGKCILLAEDNELNMEIASFILQEAGARVVPAHDGAEALELFKASEPGLIDAVVMDIMMPVMSGFEASSAIRKTGREDAAALPIIAITANVSEVDRKAALDSGMSAYLTKPIDAALLIETIAELTC